MCGAVFGIVNEGAGNGDDCDGGERGGKGAGAR
jgi:hypothetical protein